MVKKEKKQDSKPIFSRQFRCFQAPSMVAMEKSLNTWLENNPKVVDLNVQIGVADGMFGVVLFYGEFSSNIPPEVIVEAENDPN